MEKLNPLMPGARRLAPAAALLLLLFASCAVSPDGSAALIPPFGTWTGSALVATRAGAVRGSAESSATIAWKGIPYAAAPVGDLRWKAPRPVASWQGVRDASSFGPQATQRLPVLGWATGSEDCLYLNVWRPADGRPKLPVYVWIHGGGNSTGSASMSDYHGDALSAKAGVVFVSVGYRLGPFGWFARPGKTGNAEDDSGNYGTLDLIAALGWVRDNIASFGGDPGNVTIAGESAGAFNVLTLLLAPAARGLFHRAVVESGYRTDSTPAKMAAFAEKIAAKIPGSLADASAGSILTLAPSGLVGMLDLPYPNWDGSVLPAEGFAAFSDPAKVADVPLVIGTNKEEIKLFQWLGGKNWRDPSYQKGAELASARWKADGADSIADAILRGDPRRKVYVYRFDWGAPDATGKSVQGGNAGAKLGAAHAMEVSFFLQNESLYSNPFLPPVFTKENEEGRKELQAVMGSYLAAFVAEGDPNADIGLADMPKLSRPAWEPWSAASPEPPFMVFDAGLKEPRLRLERGRITIQSTNAAIADNPEPFRADLSETMQ